jgi:putative glutamine transport system substrate-binding protein
LADYPTLKTALTSGRIDAFSVDKSILSGYVDAKTEIMGEGFASQEYGIATKKSNTELADYLDKQVKTLKSNGELKKMTDKYNLKDATAK